MLLKNSKGVLPLGGSGMAASSQVSAAAGKKKLAVLGPNANRTLTLTANYAGCKSGAGGPILPECTFVNPLQGLTASARASGEWDESPESAKPRS